MRKNKRRKPMGEINVVPYIDVTLVLLIIFMITTPMLQSGVEVDLPETESSSDPSSGGKPPIVISIKADGQYYINVDGVSDDLVSPEEVNARVLAELGEKKNVKVAINADKTLDYGTVVKVMASLTKAGVPKVGLITRPSDQ